LVFLVDRRGQWEKRRSRLAKTMEQVGGKGPTLDMGEQTASIWRRSKTIGTYDALRKRFKSQTEGRWKKGKRAEKGRKQLHGERGSHQREETLQCRGKLMAEGRTGVALDRIKTLRI